MAFLFVLSSCQDFLNIELQDQILRDEVFNMLEGIDVVIIGAYSSLGVSDYYCQNFMAYLELVGNMQFNLVAVGVVGVADN